MYFASCRVTCSYYRSNFERSSLFRAHSSFDIHLVLRQSVSVSAHSDLFVLIPNAIKCLTTWAYCLIERAGQKNELSQSIRITYWAWFCWSEDSVWQKEVQNCPSNNFVFFSYPQFFFKEVPKCVAQQKVISTQHVYLTDPSKLICTTPWQCMHMIANRAREK